MRTEHITFLVCRHLVVYKDSGYVDGSLKFGKARINNAECEQEQENKPCANRGQCIIAKDSHTWRRVSTKSFGVKQGLKLEVER